MLVSYLGRVALCCFCSSALIWNPYVLLFLRGNLGLSVAVVRTDMGIRSDGFDHIQDFDAGDAAAEANPLLGLIPEKLVEHYAIPDSWGKSVLSFRFLPRTGSLPRVPICPSGSA